MKPAIFNYSIMYLPNNVKALAINDVGNGTNKTVTNSIEEVIDKIRDEIRINPKDYIIVYSDSTSFWDGWDATQKSFILLSPGIRNANQAIEEMIQIKKTNDAANLPV
jgi:hypothetical protein